MSRESPVLKLVGFIQPVIKMITCKVPLLVFFVQDNKV